jgi:DNA-binding beta-propeller fold protein YncE
MTSTSPPAGTQASRSGYWFLALAALILAAGTIYGVYLLVPETNRAQASQAPAVVLASAAAVQADDEKAPKRNTKADDEDRLPVAPELEGGVAWLNTAGPIKLKDLRGKFVLLDFWTLCCINCIHTLPDLAKLEKKYAKELVVIGVHTAKFDNEKETESIRKAILRYEITHPVVNDANQRIWRTYGAQSWPTIVLIDPEGNYLGHASGEGNCDAVDRLLTKLIKIHKDKKTLNEKPIRFALARQDERGDSPLFFPGKVLADAASKRLFIADSTHHRIVITDLDGKKIAIAGCGESGKADGPFDTASFNDPQGMALKGEILYVADRKNHLIRALDLANRRVKTVAGTGEQDRAGRFGGGSALSTGLNSPWDLLVKGNTLYIAMAGHHQIWTLDLAKETILPFAGDGRENIRDGTVGEARFAQPSGLTTDGKTLWVADSEVSAIRSVPLDGSGEVTTLVGEGLFEFGDNDGTGPAVRLQHALGVAYHSGLLYVADTYNSKIKVLDPVKRTCTTFLGEPAGWLGDALFNEPGGLSFAGDTLYVADTNSHRIRVVDVKAKTVKTLTLQGVEAPKLAQ